MIVPVTGVPDLSRRMAWTLAALAPAIVLEALGRGGAWLAALSVAVAVAIALALVAAVLASKSGSSIAARLRANIDVVVIVALVFLLLPGDGNLWFACAATAGSVLLARSLFGGLGQNLFHPAMLALAVIGLATSSSLTPVQFSQWGWIACWLGGVALLAQGILSWRAPIAFLAGSIVAALLIEPTSTEFASIADVLAGASLVICAVFIAGDPVTGCIQPRARLAHGFLSGALAMLFIRWQPATGLPLAMLLMNFFAPWLDQVLATPRRPALAR